MSAFRDMVAADMGDVFLDMDEFAGEHDLNGAICPCVVESPSSRERFQQGKEYDGYGTIHGAAVTVHARKADVGEMPTEGERFTLDGETYLVETCTEHMGMLEIHLRSNVTGVFP